MSYVDFLFSSKGIFRKLAANPMSKVEQNASRILKLTVTLLLSLAVSLSVAWILFQALPQINAVIMILILCGTVLFAGLSILLTFFMKTKWQ